MSRHGYGGHGGRYQMEHAMGSLIGLMIVLTVILIFLLIKALNMIVRVMKKYPDIIVLKIQAVLTGIFALLALVTLGSQSVASVFGCLAMGTFLVLTVTARMIEIYHNQYFIEENASLRERVLKRPWWQGQEQIDAV